MLIVKVPLAEILKDFLLAGILKVPSRRPRQVANTLYVKHTSDPDVVGDVVKLVITRVVFFSWQGLSHDR